VVGIIANPNAGKDIRRLVARGSIFDNNEKVNIVVRLLTALAGLEVERVLCMPDTFAIAARAVDRLSGAPAPSVEVLETPVNGVTEDTTRAAALMRARGVGCIVCIGGDGTSRAAAKGSGEVPLLPLSTGTNNVFPAFVESTCAGIAAGVIARGLVSHAEGTYRAKRLEVYLDGDYADLALVDVAGTTDPFVGARALWDMGVVREIVLTRCALTSTGMSAVGGCFRHVGSEDRFGLHLRVGEGGATVRAAVAPGLLADVPIRAVAEVALGAAVRLSAEVRMGALDGEREVEVRRGAQAEVRLSPEGPRVVDIVKTLRRVAEAGHLRSPNGGGPMWRGQP
jgi:predicted polyphosphate/ATP-dependent NAD kinase